MHRLTNDPACVPNNVRQLKRQRATKRDRERRKEREEKKKNGFGLGLNHDLTHMCQLELRLWKIFIRSLACWHRLIEALAHATQLNSTHTHTQPIESLVQTSRMVYFHFILIWNFVPFLVCQIGWPYEMNAPRWWCLSPLCYLHSSIIYYTGLRLHG